MIRPAAGLLLAALAAGGPAAAQAADCGFPDGGAAAGRLQVQGHAWLYRYRPAAVEVASPFAVELQRCSTGPVEPEALDAVMPAHRHGMNYRPQLRALGAGLWRAEGLLFHMPGLWRLKVRFVGPAGRSEAQADLILR